LKLEGDWNLVGLWKEVSVCYTVVVGGYKGAIFLVLVHESGSESEVGISSVEACVELSVIT